MAVDIVHEFNRKYRDTYVQLKFKDKIIPVYVYRLEYEDSDNHTGKLLLRVSAVSKVSVGKDFKFDVKRDEVSLNFAEVEVIERPQATQYTYDGVACFMHSRAERQWVRGFSNSNTRLFSHFEPLIDVILNKFWNLATDKETGKSLTDFIVEHRKNPEGRSFHFGSYIAASSPEYLTIPDFYQRVQEKEVISAAITKDFALSCFLIPEEYLLIFRKEVIGVVRRRTNSVSLFYPELQQEVLDLFHRQGLNYYVK